MVAIEHILRDPAGLHGELVSSIVAAARRRRTPVGVRFMGIQVKADDPVGLMRLDVREGETLLITASGPDEQEAVNAVVAALDGRG